MWRRLSSLRVDGTFQFRVPPLLAGLKHRTGKSGEPADKNVGAALKTETL
jgi:hypothetical protein